MTAPRPARFAGMSSARPFLSGIIDYAGLFPPAKLDMPTAVRNYADYMSGPDSDLLGRFVLPASRIGEFAKAAATLLPRGAESSPWRLSVIGDQDITSVREAALEFNCKHWNGSEAGHAVCDSVEIAVRTTDAVSSAREAFPEFFRVFLEIPVSPNPSQLVSAAARKGAAAKIRTGGVVAEAIPQPGDVVRFIAACNEHGARFKATAGLHHPICSKYPLTYEPASASARMYGYINVLLASAFLRSGAEHELVRDILLENDPAAFALAEAGVTWRSHRVAATELRDTREQFFLSFGSCSFQEPVDEAKSLGFLDSR